MNFFDHQRLAKKQSQRLVIVFVLTFIFTIAITSIAILILLKQTTTCSGDFLALGVCPHEWQILWKAIICLSLLILGGSLIRYLELKSDPYAVAKILNATEVDPQTHDLDQKKYYNIVEEMAIASGTPMPKVYILAGESSLNALAAGTSIHHSMVAITEGLAAQLNRAELQAVIGHEFSHIVHGDIKLNNRLLIAVHGISMINQIGAFIIRMSSRQSRRMISRNDRDSRIQIMSIGWVLYILGYFGLLMSRMLKASISRQREYLADAAAVQYTRNPEALISCFKKLWAFSSKHTYKGSHGETFSHMFFAENFFKESTSLFSTHPALPERIKRIDKRFNLVAFRKQELPELIQSMLIQKNEKMASQRVNGQKSEPKVSTYAASLGIVMSQLGEVNDRSIKEAHQLKASLNTEVMNFLNDPHGAIGLIHAYFFSDKLQKRLKQIMYLSAESIKERKHFTHAYTLLESLDSQQRVIALELVLTTLKNYLSKNHNLLTQIRESQKLKEESRLEDFLIYELLRLTISPSSIKKAANTKLSGLKDELRVFFTLVTRACSDSEEERQEMLNHALIKIYGGVEKDYSVAELRTSTMREALEKLSGLKSLHEQEIVLKMTLELIHKDGEIKPAEAKLARLVCLCFGVPLPLCVAA